MIWGFWVFIVILNNIAKSESECEVTVKRILELGDHSSLSCFVYVEFPYPREKMQQMKSGYIKDKSEVTLNMSMKVIIRWIFKDLKWFLDAN